MGGEKLVDEYKNEKSGQYQICGVCSHWTLVFLFASGLRFSAFIYVFSAYGELHIRCFMYVGMGWAGLAGCRMEDGSRGDGWINEWSSMRLRG